MQMWQIHFCPRCGARAASGDRFCGACGLDLACVAKPVPPPSYDYHCTYQQWVPHSTSYDEVAALADLDKYQQRYGHTAGDTVIPLSSEISKLLAGFFNRNIKYDKV